MFLKVVTNNYKGSSRVGIKFDNISAGKYFVLIHTTQQYVAMNKTSEKSELMPTESHVTQKRID